MVQSNYHKHRASNKKAGPKTGFFLPNKNYFLSPAGAAAGAAASAGLAASAAGAAASAGLAASAAGAAASAAGAAAGAATGAGAGAGAGAASSFLPQADKETANKAASRSECFILYVPFTKVMTKIKKPVEIGY